LLLACQPYFWFYLTEARPYALQTGIGAWLSPDGTQRTLHLEFRVHVRQGAGTSFPAVGTIELGHDVFVACYVDGEPVDSPNGPITQWLKLTGFGPHGWVTALYVSTGDDLTNNRIPPCPPGSA
jgi:hypothetical protein